MRRGLIFAYGAICYVIFLATFVYAIGFIGNFVVPRGLDGPTTGSLWEAFVVNLSFTYGLCAAAQRDGTSGIQRLVDAYHS